MNHVILQPSGGVGKENFENTIRKPVSLQRILPYLNTQEAELVKSYYPDGLVPVWGVVPAKGNRNYSKWKRVQAGDVALFTAEMRVFASGIVTYKFQSRELALELWGRREEQITWEYIYLLDEIQERDIPIQKVNQAIGYPVDNSVRGFTVLDDQRSNGFFSTFDIKSEIYNPSVSEEEYKDAVLAIDASKPLDTVGTSVRRTEQTFLRKYLFKNKKTGICSICSEEMPVEFLVAAHIKKRSKCTDEEKLDFENIVMPMCKFGCDDLFEKGFISVKNGEIELLEEYKKNLTPAVEEYLRKIIGQPCSYWHHGTRDYFEWHYNHHNRYADPKVSQAW